jgi:hypothetical protein
MAIKGLTEARRLPRIGKIHLGKKEISKRTGGEYPVATPYFVCPPEVQDVYGKEPRKLDVIIPLEDEEIWASQYYRQYSRTRGLVCKGDGATCRRMIDAKTGLIAGKDTKEAVWQEGCECKGRDCEDYKGKACQEVMNLQFLLPKVLGLGIWQIDTGSIHSIMNINNCATMIRAMCGRVAWIPLTLTLEPQEVNNPDDGKKKTVHCMQLRYGGSAESLIVDSERPRLQVLLGAPADDEAPDDRQLSTSNPEKLEELKAAASDAEELWGNGDAGGKSPTREVAAPIVEPKPLPIPPPPAPAPAVKQEPPMRAPDSKITKAEADNILFLMKEAGIDMTKLGDIMVRELKWKPVPSKIADLKFVQYDMLLAYLKRATGRA